MSELLHPIECPGPTPRLLRRLGITRSNHRSDDIGSLLTLTTDLDTAYETLRTHLLSAEQLLQTLGDSETKTMVGDFRREFKQGMKKVDKGILAALEREWERADEIVANGRDGAGDEEEALTERRRWAVGEGREAAWWAIVTTAQRADAWDETETEERTVDAGAAGFQVEDHEMDDGGSVMFDAEDISEA